MTPAAPVVELVAIDAVREYEGNPRRIGDRAVEAVARSIREYGWKVPIVVDAQGVVIAGHTRLRAARLLCLAQVPAIRAADLTPEQARAFRVADNKLHELSGWDLELLPIELASLAELGIDAASMGFSAEDLTAIMAPVANEELVDRAGRMAQGYAPAAVQTMARIMVDEQAAPANRIAAA